IRDDLVTGVQTCALPICRGEDREGVIDAGIAVEDDSAPAIRAGSRPRAHSTPRASSCACSSMRSTRVAMSCTLPDDVMPPVAPRSEEGRVGEAVEVAALQ